MKVYDIGTEQTVYNEQFFNHTQNDAIWGLIALFLTNQNAGNTIDFKMNVINTSIKLLIPCTVSTDYDKGFFKYNSNLLRNTPSNMPYI